MSVLYKTAGCILRDFQKKKGSLKSLVFASPVDLRAKKKIFALLCKAVAHKCDIEKVIKRCNLTEAEPELFRVYHVGVVIVCEVLYGRGLRCGGKFKEAIKRCHSQLKACQQTLQEAPRRSELHKRCQFPQYARINTLKTTVEGFMKELEDEGYLHKTFEEIVNCSCLKDGVTKVQSDWSYSVDGTVPGLLCFCRCASLTTTQWYSLSLIILQDKASCLPAFILSPPEQSVIIDACAAPGNKTTHLASITNNTGLIHAFDKDHERLQTLKLMVDRSGASNIAVRQADFTKVDPADYAQVKYILVDPSCSGSGIYNRLDYCKESLPMDRLSQLSSFQCKILNHALSFPAVERVVYSTCSVHKEENEYVVRRVLLDNASKFDIVSILPHWPSRGLPVFTKASCCIRASSENHTNGFFVAMFEKK